MNLQKLQKPIAFALLGMALALPAAAETSEEAGSAQTVAREAAGYPTLEETLERLRQDRGDGEPKEAADSTREEAPLSKRERADVEALKGEFYAMSQTQAKILSLLDRLTDRLDGIEIAGERARLRAPAPTTVNLVNPAPASNANYTQDAINAQGNSTMRFAYAPDQLYKIYCRRGYITDIAFKKGEQISYIGGGDTAGWAVSQTTVDGTPHLFIKPVVETSTTNLIVATNKKSYHIILHSSDWYNPMVEWTYAEEDAQNEMARRAQEDALRTATVSVTDIENLDSSFRVEGRRDEYKPIDVYTDGKRTYMRFKKLPKKQVPLFIQQKGERAMTIVNYRQKGDLYIVDATFEKAQLRVSERENVTIEHTD